MEAILGVSDAESRQVFNSLWLPGESLDHEFPTPEVSELQDYWRENYHDAPMVAAPGVYGIVRKPEAPVTRIASVDLCEVVRGTMLAVMEVEGKTPDQIINASRYAANVSFPDFAMVAVVQTLMNHGHIKPHDDIADIRDQLQNWREDGVYVVANTSTLPGCEIPTIKWFGEHLPDCFDGILLPRNFDGTEPITKGHALRFVVEQFGEPGRTRAIHIDDSPHHCDSVHEQVGDLVSHAEVSTFLPVYPGHTNIGEHITQTASPSEAFALADQFLRAS